MMTRRWPALLVTLCIAGLCIGGLGCVVGPRPVESAVSFERSAEAALARGDTKAALEAYQQAAEHWRSVGEHAIYGATLDSIARVHKDRGEFDEAVTAWEQALSVAKHLKDTTTVLRILSNLGVVHSAWGRYEAALTYYEESLALAETLKHEPSVARVHNNIGAVNRQLRDFDAALEHYRTALAIDERLGDEQAAATRRANMGTVYMDVGDYERARSEYTAALATARKAGQTDKIAIRLNNLGAVAVSLGEHEAALAHYREAQQIHADRGQSHELATVTSNIGSALHQLGRHDDAVTALEEAIALKERLRLGASGDIRRDYLASQIETYGWLVAAHVGADRPLAAILAADSSRARYLSDQLADLKAGDAEALARRFLAAIPEDVAVAYFLRAGDDALVRFLATSDGVQAEVLSFPKLMDDLGGDDLPAAVAHYRALVASPEAIHDAERAELGRAWYDALLGDAAPLHGREHLLVVPDGALAFLPFETLRTPRGRYLVEEGLVSYAPSLAVAALTASPRQPKEGDRRSLLALGDAEYLEEPLNERLTTLDARVLEQAQRRHGRTRGLVLAADPTGLETGSWADLPGTRREVVQITKLVPDAHALLGSEVTEAKVKEMSASGDLARYRYLHFATHGLALPEVPELSSLVLSQTDAMGDEDGFLTMAEIAELDIDAELVVLSACDTGLGKLYAGEGVVGLTQAFFIAGAREVAVSLWQVSDESTAALMVDAYRRLEGDAQGFGWALARAKRAFIARGDDWARPYYWAPFVHYAGPRR